MTIFYDEKTRVKSIPDWLFVKKIFAGIFCSNLGLCIRTRPQYSNRV